MAGLKYSVVKIATTLLLLLLFIYAPAGAFDERITLFSSEITVHEDATMTVRETIRVSSAGIAIRHGIYRDFPTRYMDRYGNGYSVRFDITEITRDGIPEPYRIANMNNGKRIYIGNSDITLSPGIYSYIITYKTYRHLGFFKEYDELYWNVTGNGWLFPIDKAVALVTLPQGIEAKDLSYGAYTGMQGSKKRAYKAFTGSYGRTEFHTIQSLSPGEGLTIYVTWPKGFVSEPALNDKVRNFFSDNLSLFIGLIGLLLLTGYYAIAWKKVGRDPEKGTVIPWYEPPKRLSPAAIRYIRRMGYDNKAFAAAIIDMAVKGYLLIQKRDKTYTIAGTGGKIGDKALSVEEQDIASMLLSVPGEAIELNITNHEIIKGALTAVRRSLKGMYNTEYFNLNTAYFIPGAAGSILILLFIAMSFSAAPALFVLAALFAIVNGLFFYLLKAPTLKGRKLMDEIEGFRLYLLVAEKDRLNFFNPPEQTPELFEKYLPYALALDVEHAWAEQFADLFERAGKEGYAYSPGWYSGSSWRRVGMNDFVSSLGSSLAGAISSSATPPGSRSGAGGFSGGGGGGGGGGGW